MAPSLRPAPVLGLLLLATAASTTAHADVRIAVVPGIGDELPHLVATIKDEPGLPPREIRLVEPRGPRGARGPRDLVIAPTSIQPFSAGPDTIAIAILFNGQEIWTGNDEIEPADSPARYPGALDGIRGGLVELDLAHRLPPGSQAALISYDSAVRELVPMGPAARLVPAAIGTQRDYYSRIGTNLVDGLELAVARLEQAHTTRKLLIVLGDGNDVNNEAAAVVFNQLEKRAQVARIEIAAIVYKGALSNEDTPITGLVRDVRMISGAANLGPAMVKSVARATDQITVTFPGTELTWDGKVADLVVSLDGRELEPVPVVMGTAPPETSSLARWLLQAGIGLGAVGALALLLRVRAARSAASGD
ncbi:MAG: hypothetical protein IPQ07_12695 [Myxococcales bacterium]|nr:hypothetical protein [Myxococcales bacterium]